MKNKHLIFSVFLVSALLMVGIVSADFLVNKDKFDVVSDIAAKEQSHFHTTNVGHWGFTFNVPHAKNELPSLNSQQILYDEPGFYKASVLYGGLYDFDGVFIEGTFVEAVVDCAGPNGQPALALGGGYKINSFDYSDNMIQVLQSYSKDNEYRLYYFNPYNEFVDNSGNSFDKDGPRDVDVWASCASLESAKDKKTLHFPF